jgi:hypothetical protein
VPKIVKYLNKNIPDVKYGVRFNNWLAVYLPGGNNKFYKEFDNAKNVDLLFIALLDREEFFYIFKFSLSYY